MKMKVKKGLQLKEDVQNVEMKECLMQLCSYVQLMKDKQYFTPAQSANLKKRKIREQKKIILKHIKFFLFTFTIW